MKNNNIKLHINYIVFCVFFVLCLFCNLNHVNAQENYEDKGLKICEESEKTWVVKFNQPLNKDTVNNSTIIVTNESGQEIPCVVLLKADKKTISITSKDKYTDGETYNLVIKNSVKSEYGKSMDKSTKMKFKVQSKSNPSNSKYTICIDAARGGKDSGNVSEVGLKEKDVNLSVALKLGKELERNGINVVYTRNSDSISWSKDEDIRRRAEIANNSKANCFINIRCNEYTNSNVNGVETYYSGWNSVSKALAQNIQQQLVSDTGLTDRGAKEGQPQHESLKGVNSNAAMIELGFMSNPQDAAVLGTEDFQNKSAVAISKGIIKSLNIINTEKNPTEPTKPEPTPNPTPTGETICIDPGHGIGSDTGATGIGGLQEDDVTLSVGLKTGQILQARGVNVVYTRKEDQRSTAMTVVSSLQKRCDISNNANAKYFVSIHCNSADPQSARGTETWLNTENGESKRLATAIQNSIVEKLGMYNRGLKDYLKDRNGLYVVSNTNAPAVLVELGFLTNASDVEKMRSEDYKQKFSEAIAEGILKVLGK